MSAPITASIVIDSYNYGRFLRTAIDSALAQTHPHTEVIVVDDGSRDDSPEIIRSYGNRIIPLIKENGGQASALNAGAKLSRGDFIVFVDSDDMLLPDTLEKAAPFFAEPNVAKVHWNLWIADPEGRTGEGTVRPDLSEGNLRDAVLRAGADGYTWPPTSGNAWARSFVEKVFPIPITEFNTCPDFYLAALAPLHGEVRKISHPQGFWRHHPVNASFSDDFEKNMNGGLRRAECCVQVLAQHAASLGLPFDAEQVRENSRWHQMQIAVERIKTVVPEGESFILVDQDHWKTNEQFIGRRRFLFPERDGQFWGYPEDDESAIRELERLRGNGAHFIVFVWPYLWWLDHYKDFAEHLRTNYRCVANDARLVAFNLRK